MGKVSNAWWLRVKEERPVLTFSAMVLRRPNRTFIIAAFGSTILIIPFIVVITSYKDNPARIQVQTWCASFLFLFASLYWSNAYVRSFCTILYSL
jgi:hypothetical protein